MQGGNYPYITYERFEIITLKQPIELAHYVRWDANTCAAAPLCPTCLRPLLES